MACPAHHLARDLARYRQISYYAARVDADTLIADADAAYERGDQAWFDALAIDVLDSLWTLCCDLAMMPSWDDEVYDALASRGHFEATA